MEFSKKVEIYSRTTEEIKSELATFFLMNNFKVDILNDNEMRVENLYPRFDIKRPPAAEIKQAEFRWHTEKDCVVIEAKAEMMQAHKLLKKRKRMIYTLLAALIILDLLYTSGSLFWPALGSKWTVDIGIILLFIPIIYVILHYHFFKVYKNKHHNDLERLLENLQYK